MKDNYCLEIELAYSQAKILQNVGFNEHLAEIMSGSKENVINLPEVTEAVLN